jgi:hypothetical protein
LINFYLPKTTSATRTVVKLIFTIIVCLPIRLFAQEQLYQQALKSDTLLKPKPPDTVAKTKHFGRAAIELGLAEVVPWTFDKFLKKAPYANISFKTVAHNLNPGSWAWDNDNFQTNQFGHPYQGSLFFSSFRSNGYSFWQAAPAAFVGSYIWESTAENQAPAPNDFINTGFGGIVLGEMTYRMSNKIINEHASGLKRQKQEVLAFVVNPMNGLTRLLNGKWGKVKFEDDPNVPGPVVDSSKISAEFDLGGRKFSVRGGGPMNTGGKFGWYSRASLLYGNRYDDYKTPFSNILVTAEFGQDDSTKVNVISVYGSLTGWLIESNSEVRHIAIISANYDYIHNEAFFYGGQSVKMNLYSEFKLDDDFKLNTAVGAGPVVLAAIPDPYLYKGRNYDYGPGFAVNGMAGIGVDDHLFLSVNYRGGFMETLNGNSSHYFLHTVTGELSFKIVDGLSLAGEGGYFRLNGTFKNYADIAKTYPYLRTSVRYAVDF